VKGDWIKPGATVIDVGINRVMPRAGQDPSGRRRRFRRGQGGCRGDHAGSGRRRPMTIAVLLRNALVAAYPMPDRSPRWNHLN
jgi:methylenetetrahydrofolate dehydrogenase (NADP+)/methenyltetrahydrofolate cyclohydrolase